MVRLGNSCRALPVTLTILGTLVTQLGCQVPSAQSPRVASDLSGGASYLSNDEMFRFMLWLAQYDPAPQVRRLAVYAIGELGSVTEPACESLQGLQRRPDLREVVEEVLERRCFSGPQPDCQDVYEQEPRLEEGTVAQLVELMRDSKLDRCVRAEAAARLEDCDGSVAEALSALLEASRAGDRRIRAAALGALGSVGRRAPDSERDIVERRLLQALDEDWPEVNVYYSMGRLGPHLAETRARIRADLRSEDWTRTLEAAQLALGVLGESDEVIRILKEGLLLDTSSIAVALAETSVGYEILLNALVFPVGRTRTNAYTGLRSVRPKSPKWSYWALAVFPDYTRSVANMLGVATGDVSALATLKRSILFLVLGHGLTKDRGKQPLGMDMDEESLAASSSNEVLKVFQAAFYHREVEVGRPDSTRLALERVLANIKAKSAESKTVSGIDGHPLDLLERALRRRGTPAVIALVKLALLGREARPALPQILSSVHHDELRPFALVAIGSVAEAADASDVLVALGPYLRGASCAELEPHYVAALSAVGGDRARLLGVMSSTSVCARRVALQSFLLSQSGALGVE